MAVVERFKKVAIIIQIGYHFLGPNGVGRAVNDGARMPYCQSFSQFLVLTTVCFWYAQPQCRLLYFAAAILQFRNNFLTWIYIIYT